MSDQIKKYIYFIAVICVIFFIGALFLKLLPYIIVIGFAAYGIAKVTKYIKYKKEQNNFQSNNNDTFDIYKVPANDYTNGEVIDVEYEEVSKK